MICLIFSMLFKSIWQCSELLTFYWLTPPSIPRIARANSGILLAGLHSPSATGAPAETRILSGIIPTNIRARHVLTVHLEKKVILPILLRFVRDDFHIYVIFCPMIIKFFLNLWPHTLSELYLAPPLPQVCSNLWWSVPPQVVLSLWYLW